MPEPRDLLADLNVTILEFDDMPVNGAYYPQPGVVALRWSLTFVRERWVLAEELAHHQLGHWPLDDPIAWNRIELRAQRRAAVGLIPIETLAAAIRGSVPWEEVADRLAVDLYLLNHRQVDLSWPELVTLAGEVDRADAGGMGGNMKGGPRRGLLESRLAYEHESTHGSREVCRLTVDAGSRYAQRIHNLASLARLCASNEDSMTSRESRPGLPALMSWYRDQEVGV